METSLIASLASLVLAIAGILTAIFTRSKNRAEAASTITESTLKLLEPLNQRISYLEEREKENKIIIQKQERELSAIRVKLKEYCDGANKLVNQLESLRIIPAWKPKKLEGRIGGI